MGFLYLEGVDVVRTFYILIDDSHIGLLCNFVCDDRDTCVVRAYVID